MSWAAIGRFWAPLRRSWAVLAPRRGEGILGMDFTGSLKTNIACFVCALSCVFDAQDARLDHKASLFISKRPKTYSNNRYPKARSCCEPLLRSCIPVFWVHFSGFEPSWPPRWPHVGSQDGAKIDKHSMRKTMKNWRLLGSPKIRKIFDFKWIETHVPPVICSKWSISNYM